jgi:hypothetical protein
MADMKSSKVIGQLHVLDLARVAVVALCCGPEWVVAARAVDIHVAGSYLAVQDDFHTSASVPHAAGSGGTMTNSLAKRTSLNRAPVAVQLFGRDSVYAGRGSVHPEVYVEREIIHPEPARLVQRTVQSPRRAAADFYNATFTRAIDDLRSQVSVKKRSEQNVWASVTVGATAVSVGYVFWLLRVGLLIAAVVSALPAWHLLDPLPILNQTKRNRGDAAGSEDALEQLFQNKLSQVSSLPRYRHRPATRRSAPSSVRLAAVGPGPIRRASSPVDSASELMVA